MIVLASTLTLVAQTTSGSLSGVINDAQGAAVPNAKVDATSTARGETQTTQTDSDGRFTFPQLQPDTYTIRIEAPNFKAFEKTNVVINANDRASAGDIALEVGQVSETVTVTSSGEELQTESGERSSAIIGEQLQNIAVNGRSYLALATLSPGVVSNNNYQVAGTGGLGGISVNGARGNQNNLTLDGIGNVDTGSNGGQLASVSLDAVSEYKILTGSYQAEYGRSSGAQISVVTKSGTQDFHGSGFLYHRNEGLNANNWLNNRDGRPRNLFRFNNFGGTIGGPVYIPGLFNKQKEKLFFFFSQEFQRQLRPQANRNVTLPTALERRGDFSQSVDRDGNRVFIRDYTRVNPTTGAALPCIATDQSGCFPGNVIPQNRLYAPGAAILNIYPLPNAQSTANRGFNFQSQIPDSYPRREDMLRIDYNPTDTWRVYGRYINNFDSVTSNYGSFVLGANTPVVPITDARPGKHLAINITKTINPTTINEFVFGFGKNQIDIFAVNEGLTRSATGLSRLPALYPGAIQGDYVPRFQFEGIISNGPTFGTQNAPFFNFNRTIDFVDNFSKLLGKHAIKTGFYFQRSQKDQTSFGEANGTINFSNNTANPFDTGFAFANAALGVYNSYVQATQYATGRYRYTNFEFYVQDNWKTTRKLTLDYGIRFYYIQPQYDQSLQTSTFIPELFDRSQAVRLYRPTVINNQNRAIDPLTGQTLDNTNVGRIVPGSGDLLNGIRLAGQGVNKGLMENRGIHYAPRFGFAYDVTGESNIVVRGGGGIYYDRFQGNETFDMLTNPPTTSATTLVNGLFTEIDLTRAALPTPIGLNAFSYEGKIPTVYSYNLGIQTKLPFDFTLDVAYVGSQSRHLLQRLNINAVPYGATYQRENQDPRLFGGNIPTTQSGLAVPFAQAGLNFSGANSVFDNFLRPYQGYGNINLHQMGGTSNYNSLQTEINRRFARDLFLGLSYTWSRNMTTVEGDGSFIRIDDNTRFSNYAPADLHRRHNLSVNFVYETPRLTNNRALGFITNGWQVSGIYRYQTGQPYGIGVSIPNIGSRELTGSNTEGARARVIGNPGRGNTTDPYQQFNTNAFAPPLPGSRGLESGRNYLERHGINNWDLSLQKNFYLGETTRFELRLDAFNAFNHTQFNVVNSTLNVRSLTDFTPTNLPYDAAGNLVNRNGFGTISTNNNDGVRNPRILQLVARFQF